MSVLQAALSIIQAGAVTGAAVVAAWGLNAWRREMIGRKKADVAEHTLASFYEARDIISAARFPGAHEPEGQTRPPVEGETASDAQYRNAVYIPAERLFKENESFARLEALKYRFMALFGTEKAKPFDTIKTIRNRILISSGMLIRTRGHPAEERAELQRSREKWERNIGLGIMDEDPLADEVEAVLSEIEQTCRDSLTGKKY